MSCQRHSRAWPTPWPPRSANCRASAPLRGWRSSRPRSHPCRIHCARGAPRTSLQTGDGAATGRRWCAGSLTIGASNRSRAGRVHIGRTSRTIGRKAGFRAVHESTTLAVTVGRLSSSRALHCSNAALNTAQDQNPTIDGLTKSSTAASGGAVPLERGLAGRCASRVMRVGNFRRPRSKLPIHGELLAAQAVGFLAVPPGVFVSDVRRIAVVDPGAPDMGFGFAAVHRLLVVLSVVLSEVFQTGPIQFLIGGFGSTQKSGRRRNHRRRRSID